MKPTLHQRLRYHFDNLMARGTPAMIGMLFVLSLLVVLIAGAIISTANFVQDETAESLSFGRDGEGLGRNPHSRSTYDELVH